MEWLTTATEAVTSVMSSTISTITTQPILAMCFVGGVIIPMGVRVFRKLRRA